MVPLIMRAFVNNSWQHLWPSSTYARKIGDLVSTISESSVSSVEKPFSRLIGIRGHLLDFNIFCSSKKPDASEKVQSVKSSTQREIHSGKERNAEIQIIFVESLTLPLILGFFCSPSLICFGFTIVMLLRGNFLRGLLARKYFEVQITVDNLGFFEFCSQLLMFVKDRLVSGPSSGDWSGGY